MLKKFYTILPISALIVLLLTNCSDTNKPKNDIIVGISDSYPPFEYIDHKTGEVIGFDIDLAKKIGQLSGANIVMHKMKFSSLASSLKNGEIDMAIAAISPDINRLEHIDFSTPYYATPLVCVFNIDAPISKLSELENKKVGIEKGTVMASYMAADKYKNIIKKVYNNELEIIKALQNDQIDAAIMEEGNAANYIRKDESLAILLLPKTVGSYAIAFPKNSSLRKKVNDILQELSQSGELEKIRKSHKISMLPH